MNARFHGFFRRFSIVILVLAVIALSTIIWAIIYFGKVFGIGVEPPKVCHSSECIRSASALQQHMNPNVDPCEDFYGYVCGYWADENPPPENYMTDGWHDMGQRKINHYIRSRLAGNVSQDDPIPVKQAKIMYKSCLSNDPSKTVGQNEGIAIVNYLREFGLPTLPTLLEYPKDGPRNYKFDWIAAVARIQRKLGFNVLISFDIENDKMDKNRNRLTLGYGYKANNLNFPTYEWPHPDNHRISARSVEESATDVVSTFAKKFLAIAKALKPGFDENKLYPIFRTLGDKYFELELQLLSLYFDNEDDEEVAKKDGKDDVYDDDDISRDNTDDNSDDNEVNGYEKNTSSKRILSSNVTKSVEENDENGDPQDKKDGDSEDDDQKDIQLLLTVRELQVITDEYIASSKPYPIWQRYLDELFEPFPEAKPTVEDRLQMSKVKITFLKKLSKVVSKQSLKVIELFIWGKVTLYIIENKYNKINEEVDCAEYVKTNMGLAVGHMIADKNFLNNTKPRVEHMLNGIRDEFNQMVQETDWMDEDTKHATLEKSKAMKSLIGFPEWILDVGKLEDYYHGITKDHYLVNWVNVKEFLVKKRLQTWRRNNENYFNIDPMIVNAYYLLLRNTIYIPGAIIQYPTYFLGIEALNYGAIGAILGHEVTHGFDNDGRFINKFGNMKQWWSQQTMHEYDKRASCFVEQYNNYYLEEAKGFVNGSLTLSENIADNGGLREAFRAYRAFAKRNGAEPKLPGIEKFSHEQLFFISFGHRYCSTETEEAARFLLKMDVHSPNKFRVRGTLSNMPEFSEAFQCAPGKPMNPEKKCRIW